MATKMLKEMPLDGFIKEWFVRAMNWMKFSGCLTQKAFDEAAILNKAFEAVSEEVLLKRKKDRLNG
ncbi:hypothetical protein CTI12_AA614960 [Artemisia annua]|uniref:Uncharacterized protein n=1 Tax=Artemisia annua TaxID=35608 RepID=A0A2U1KE32_ARTAN|nr:hypothetical protein CTI12_AA614960 [Artemisia annua]